MKGFLCITISLLLSLLFSLLPTIKGCGMSTHSEVADRALFWFQSTDHPEYQEILKENRGWYQPGTFFPDWGYSCGGASDEAESAHWPPFINATAHFLRESLPKPWGPEERGTVAFLFGIMAHSVADDSWHALGVDEGLIEVMRDTEFRGSYSQAHSKADTGGEFVLKFISDRSGKAEPRWLVPSEFLSQAYSSYYQGYQVPPGDMDRCMLLGFAGIWANQLLGDLALPFVQNSPFLVEEYENHFLGGLNDMATWTSSCWGDLVRWIEGEGPARPMCTLMENQWDRFFELSPPSSSSSSSPNPKLEGQEALDFLENLGYRVSMEKQGRHHVFELQRRDGTDPILHHVTQLKELKKKMEETWKAEEAKEEGAKASMAEECAKEADFSNSSLSLVSLVPYSELGYSAAYGDFNNDGIDDLALGAPSYGRAGSPQIGVVYIIYGNPKIKPLGALVQDIELLADRTIVLDAVYAKFGPSLSPSLPLSLLLFPSLLPFSSCLETKKIYICNPGSSLTVVDMNQDGIDDLAISAPTYNGLKLYYDGRVYVYSGSPSGLSEEPFVEIKMDQPNPESDFRGTHPFKYSLIGYSLSSEDIDQDGFKDLVVGSPLMAVEEKGHEKGMVSIFLSSSNHRGLLDIFDAADYQITGKDNYQRFGTFVKGYKTNEGEMMVPLLLFLCFAFFPPSAVLALVSF